MLLNQPRKPIKVAVIIGKMNGAGVEKSVLNHYRCMDHDKVVFDFITCASSTKIPYKDIEEERGRVIVVPDYSNPVAYYKALKRAIAEGSYDVVHAHTTALSAFPMRAAKLAGVPIRIAHSRSSSGDKERFRNIVKGILKTQCKRYQTHSFACSELAARWLFGTLENVQIWPNATSLSKYNFNLETRARIRGELGIPDNCIVVGNVGRLSTQKNQDFLLQVFERLLEVEPNSRLLVAGEGELEEELKALSAKLGIASKVMFLGHRDDADALYQAMDVFCLPSLYEGLPNVIVEAQAAGLPCLCSECVTKEVALTSIVKFASLEQSASEWASCLLGLAKTVRKGRIEELTAAGYEVSDSAMRLQDFYESEVKKAANRIV